MTEERLISMSHKEILRLKTLEQLQSKIITQKIAGKILSLSVRQVRRLSKSYAKNGAAGLVSKKRTHISNNKIPIADKKKIIEITRAKYADFGPTFLSEKLLENHSIVISKETLRQWLIEENLHKSKRRSKARIHQMRERRPSFGELIQIDGSPHDWFEGRREKCCLLVYVDDATSKLVNLRFEEAETTAGYFRTTKEYISKYGLPVAMYSDRHNIFRVNMPTKADDGITQFGQAMNELGIEIICANSPQAKGRVERANGILQDRLVKELRLRGISDINTANLYLPEFIERYNKKFAVEPKSSFDSHVKLIGNENLDLIFSLKHTRSVSKNLELIYKTKIYQIKDTGSIYRLRHARVTVYENLAGEIKLIYKGKKLDYSCYERQKKTAKTARIVETKLLNHKVDAMVRASRKPSTKHPWRSTYKPTPPVFLDVSDSIRGSAP
jgi:hypothetical protein